MCNESESAYPRHQPFNLSNFVHHQLGIRTRPNNPASPKSLSMFLGGGVGELSNNMFESNTGTNGAGVWQNDCDKVTHQENHFLSNVATQGSAGIEMNQGKSLVTTCTFTKGKGAKGGGLYMQVGWFVPCPAVHTS